MYLSWYYHNKMNTSGVIRVIRLIRDSDIVRRFVGGAYAHAFAQHTTKAAVCASRVHQLWEEHRRRRKVDLLGGVRLDYMFPFQASNRCEIRISPSHDAFANLSDYGLSVSFVCRFVGDAPA